ncbi:MAG: thioesterase family protein [Candidatus Omnitrophota bacterium]
MDGFYIEKKVYYHDTDCGGVVYYANYLKYVEEACTEYLSSKGLGLKVLFRAGVKFVTAHIEADYKGPAGYGDILRIYIKIESLGDTSLHFQERIEKGAAVIFEAKTVWVCVDKDFKPVPLPEDIRKPLCL